MATEISEMYCTCCQKRGIPIPRNKQNKEPGHLKKLYCIYCGAERNHVEIRPFCSDYNYEDFQLEMKYHNDYNYEDFLLEMKYHNFDSEGNRKEPYRMFRGKLKKEGII